MDQQHWWKLLVSDKSGLMNTDDKVSVLIQTVTIIAVTGVATLSWTDLIPVLLNAVTDHTFFHVYTSANKQATNKNTRQKMTDWTTSMIGKFNYLPVTVRLDRSENVMSVRDSWIVRSNSLLNSVSCRLVRRLKFVQGLCRKTPKENYDGNQFVLSLYPFLQNKMIFNMQFLEVSLVSLFFVIVLLRTITRICIWQYDSAKI